MKEIRAMYENYSTVATEENLNKCRVAVEEIIVKYENYYTKISNERTHNQSTEVEHVQQQATQPPVEKLSTEAQ